MKKILSVILMLALVLSLAACGNKPVDEVANTDTDINQEEVKDNKEETKEEDKKEDKEEVKEENKEDDKKEDKEDKEEDKKPSELPEEKPSVPEQDPSQPEVVPETNKSVGNTLLADFKAQPSSSSALEIAERLIANPIIAFAGGAMPVEPGLLTGFNNTEITGFKEGAMFAPMIGTIPFVGYIFTLDSATNASDFVATLKASANLRWNICTEADEMVAGVSGNKVFFVMSPISFDEEE